MNKIGLIKSIDNLGRIGIPKEIRKQYNLNGDIEIVFLEEGLLIRNPKYVLVEKQAPEIIKEKPERS